MSQIETRWLAVCGGGIFFATALLLLSPLFDSAVARADRPVFALVALLVIAGAGFVYLMPQLVRDGSATRDQSLIFLMLVTAGLAARLILFASQPILENDFQRYLWDGAVAANGHNPYAHSPHAVIEGRDGGTLHDLKEASGDVLENVGHKALTTIYPPVAQAAFALAYEIAPFNLNAWRGVLLAGDLATLALLVMLLDGLKRSRLWSALYWLNPLVLKEGFNSAHMEPVLMPLVLLAVLFAWQRRAIFSALALGLAIGIKLWPVLLAPVLFRPLLTTDRRALAIGGAIVAAMTALSILPLVIGGAPSETAGVAAYSAQWSTNSAIYPAWEAIVGLVLKAVHLTAVDPALPARAVFAGLVVASALYAARSPWTDLDELLRRVLAIIVVLLLASPAQYPWYSLWAMPFLAVVASRALLTAVATLPIYYTLFYFVARDQADVFTHGVVWLIWVPIWIGVILDIMAPVRLTELKTQVLGGARAA